MRAYGLERLCKLPFDVIKLDRSLLLGIERTPVDVLSSIYQLTNLCQALVSAWWWKASKRRT